MESERRWVPHYPLIATAEILEVRTEQRIRARTSNLGLLGCYLDMANPFPVGSEVRVQLTYQDATFTALGDVVRSELHLGMGIRFAAVELDQQALLVKWLASFSRITA